VTVSASSGGKGSVSDVVDFEQPTSFSTGPDGEPWIRLDFQDRIVKPTGYTIIIPPVMLKYALDMDNFKLQISVDAKHWTTIDKRRRLEGSDAAPDLCHYVLAGNSDEGRYLRILGEMGEEASHSNAALIVIAWEVFGTIRMRTADDPVAPPPEPPKKHTAPGFPMAAGAPGRLTKGSLLGICRDGRPLPAELSGLATFLAERNADDVVVTKGSPPSETFPFGRLPERGVMLHARNGGVEVHFVHHRVRVTHYALVATVVFGGISNPSWEVDSAGEDSVWRTVDVRGGVASTRQIRTFALAAPVECSRVRIRCLAQGPAQLLVHGFDVFGTVLD
jgi:hypothetical protein